MWRAKLVAVMAVPLMLVSCGGLPLTPDQVAAIDLCKDAVWDAATGELCLGQAVTHVGTPEAIAITCAIAAATQALPACASIIPTFLTVNKTSGVGLGAGTFEAAPVQTTAFGQMLQHRVTKSLSK